MSAAAPVAKAAESAVPPLYWLEGQRGKPPKLKLSLHPGQLRAWKSGKRFVFVFAGTQSGKTSFGPLWLWHEIRRTQKPEGGNDYLAVTNSYDMFQLKMLPELRKLFEYDLKVAKWWAGNQVLELRDPSGQFWAKKQDDAMYGRIILRSAASGGGLESATARAAWLDECGQENFTIETWEAILRRLSLYRGRVLGTTTLYNLGWLKTEVYDRWARVGTPTEKPGDRAFDVIQFRSTENPLFSAAEYARAKESMPAYRFRMQYEGEFAKPAGMIYDCYEEGYHCIEPFAIPDSWPRTVGLDFGGANTCLVWIAYDSAGDRYIIYDESLSGNKSTVAHVGEANAKAYRLECRFVGGAKGETQQRLDWSQAGIMVGEPKISDVEAGIARGYQLFAQRKMFVFATCRGFRDQIGRYVRKVDAFGEPLEEIADKAKFHYMDAYRYACTDLLSGYGWGQGSAVRPVEPSAPYGVDYRERGRR